jgi:hypothetical protein
MGGQGRRENVLSAANKMLRRLRITGQTLGKICKYREKYEERTGGNVRPLGSLAAGETGSRPFAIEPPRQALSVRSVLLPGAAS